MRPVTVDDHWVSVMMVLASESVSAALQPGPVEIAFDAEHQRVDLPIGADLTAADKAGLVEGVIRAGKRVAPRGVGKAGAEIAADINSRPIVKDRKSVV